MAELDDIIHQPLRLKIMAALNALPATAGLEFARLKKLTGATDGNLGAHIETLAKAGYVSIDKDFASKKLRTTITATAAGFAASSSEGERRAPPLEPRPDSCDLRPQQNPSFLSPRCTFSCSVPAAANMPWRGRSRRLPW